MINERCQSCLNEPKPAYFTYATPTRDVNYICKSCSKKGFFRRFYPEAHLQPLDSKQVRRYNLPLDHRYTLISIDYLGSLLDGGSSSCENCGKLIVNVATVKTETGNSYRIGLDCAETLSFTDNTTYWKIKEAVALHAKILKWVRTTKEAQKTKTVISEFNQEYNRWIVSFNNQWQYRLSDKIYQAYFKTVI